MPDVAVTRLEGWKAIADHLGRDARTAQRWHRERGMPVHHVPGGGHGTVFAYRTELDAWLTSGAAARRSTQAIAQRSGTTPITPDSDPAPSGPKRVVRNRRRQVVLALAGATLLTVVGVALVNISSANSDAVPSRAELHGDTLSALNSRNERLWSVQLAGAQSSQQSGLQASLERVLVADLDGDSTRELIAALNHGDQRGKVVKDAEVLCLSTRGSLLWSYRPAYSLTFAGREFAGPWRVYGAAVAGAPNRGVWAAFIDRTWWPSFVVHLGADGSQRLALINSGHIEALLELNDENAALMLAGGFNNEFMLPAVAAFDPHRPLVTSPQTPGTPFYCDNCPESRPHTYVLLPRGDVNIALGSPFISVAEIEAPDTRGLIEVSVRDSQVSGRAVYRFDRELRPVSVAFSDAYWGTHRRLSAEGKLDHKPQDCPERHAGVSVRVWQPATGWQELRVAPTFASRPQVDRDDHVGEWSPALAVR